MRDLTDKVAWITGAGTGIGRAGALALAAAGMKVVLSGRRREKLEEVVAAIAPGPGEALVEPLDVADRAAVDGVAERLAARFGRLDVLVNSAGLNVLERHWENLTPEGFDQVVAINLNGAFYCCFAALPMMRAQGDGLVVNVSSWAGVRHSFLTGPAYGASKFGLGALTENINIEEGLNGIRATAICPGEVATEILDRRPIPVSEADKARMVQAEDTGEIILFLARLPANVCINELVVSPTWNRTYVAAAKHFRG
ncbi:MAG TPA: SDR family oxidoreductase [Alphaproteobacteria bacterium]|jgi:NAD(P)-dependent dehydrogenase (short-subunit alcohol dehydrogenase family)|nr:SDR family oxidoreductase [Alphaproteobacteria bacterium]MDP7426799.1 SDR family oxidoreductase [Alphaproteobacteria bacterium]HJM49007.1 SDR family oxidoreductase [Alphaproteobacteria bacterium]